MLSTVYSGAVQGVDAHIVEIEVNAGGGDPQIVIVGLPDAAVRESKDRVWTAIANQKFILPQVRNTVNLAPADIKKEGPSFDLPIAVGIIANDEHIEPEQLARFSMVGELALSGEVRRVKGVLPIAMRSRLEGRQSFIVPADNAEEAAVVEGLDVYPVRTLRQAVDFVKGDLPQRPFKLNIERVFQELRDYDDDFADVIRFRPSGYAVTRGTGAGETGPRSSD